MDCLGDHIPCLLWVEELLAVQRRRNVHVSSEPRDDGAEGSYEPKPALPPAHTGQISSKESLVVCVPASFLAENLCALPLYAVGLLTEVARGDCPEACYSGVSFLRLMRHGRREKRTSLLQREAAKETRRSVDGCSELDRAGNRLCPVSRTNGGVEALCVAEEHPHRMAMSEKACSVVPGRGCSANVGTAIIAKGSAVMRNCAHVLSLQ